MLMLENKQPEPGSLSALIPAQERGKYIGFNVILYISTKVFSLNLCCVAFFAIFAGSL
jgi:hypothetical protein